MLKKVLKNVFFRILWKAYVQRDYDHPEVIQFVTTSLRQKKSTDSIADIFSGFGSISNLISNMKSVDLAVTFSNRDLMAISCTLSSGDVFHNLSDN